MVKALARAFRRRNLPEAGAYGAVEEIATVERIRFMVCDLRERPALPLNRGIPLGVAAEG